MRRAALVTVLLGASACCVDVQPDAACVVNRYPFPYCHDVARVQYFCWDDDPDPSYYETRCDGALHEGDDCEDLGFTQGCPGGHFVRPGNPC